MTTLQLAARTAQPNREPKGHLDDSAPVAPAHCISRA